MDANERIQSLFDRAVELAPDQREQFLKSACDDEAVRAEVLRLLSAYDNPSAEIAEPLVDSSATLEALGGSVAEFRLIRQLGYGGMGDVYLAEDTILKRKVALKTLAPRLMGSEQAVGRFRHEAQAAARLAHPGIVRVFSYGEHEGTHYIAMEYIAGETLAKRLDTLAHPTLTAPGPEHAPPSDPAPKSAPAPKDSTGFSTGNSQYLRQAVQIVITVAESLEFAHKNNVIHRDVKPSNILLDQQGGAHLADFGIARIVDFEPTTLTSEFAGTCYYASPEQAAAKREGIDHRSDIFSLGIVLYEALTQRRPFQGATPQQILEAVCNRDPIHVRKLNPRVHRDLATICHKALEKDPKDRYQTAAHFAADLVCQLRGDPILARPPGLIRRGRHFLRRRRVQTLSAVIVLLVGAVAFLARQDVIREQALLCPLTVRSEPSGALVIAQQYDQASLELQQGIMLGRTPLIAHRVKPGQYRLTIAQEGGRFLEALVYSPKPGIALELDVQIPHRTATYFEGMVRVDPGGVPCVLGREFGEGFERRRTKSVRPFWIDRAEVTNAQYKLFVDATGHEPPTHWRKFGYDAALSELPVVAITWDDAQQYARWLGKRLPTAEEWECAARYPDGRLLPWGNETPAPQPVVTAESIAKARSADWSLGYEAYSANVRPAGEDASPSALGLYHLFGNVNEMTENITSVNGPALVAKGGAWQDVPGIWDISRTVLRPVVSVSLTTGFRCAVSDHAYELN